MSEVREEFLQAKKQVLSLSYGGGGVDLNIKKFEL